MEASLWGPYALSSFSIGLTVTLYVVPLLRKFTWCAWRSRCAAGSTRDGVPPADIDLSINSPPCAGASEHDAYRPPPPIGVFTCTAPL